MTEQQWQQPNQPMYVLINHPENETEYLRVPVILMRVHDERVEVYTVSGIRWVIGRSKATLHIDNRQ